jgi:PAS domain S-box-containing protein
MKYEEKTREQLINELVELRQRIAELDAADTERKRAEEALREAHLLLEKTFSSLNEAVFVVDPDTRAIIACNQAVGRIFGYSEHEVVGRNTEFLHVERAMYEKFGLELYPALEANGVYHSEFQMQRKDGSVFFTEHTVTEIVDDTGNRTGLVSVVRDITKRKQAEEAVRTLKEFNENVVQSVQDGIVAVDRDFRITLWNKAMEEIRGFKAEEVLGNVITEVFPHVIEQGLDELFQAALDGEVVEGTNFSYQMPNGETVYTNERFLPLKDQAGAVIGAFSIVEDVTETLRLEERVIQLQQEIEQRKLVEVAKGVLMRELVISEAESYKFIQKKSRDENRKMGEVAKLVIQLHGTSEERKKFT